MDNREIEMILYGLAKEIHFMSEEEKNISFKKIIRAEKRGEESEFWTKIAKKMLTEENFHEEIIRKLDSLIY